MSARIPLYQVDAFAAALFKGNPAAVCPLERWLDDATLQAIGNENNLSETAFLVGGDGRYELRWFTPAAEVALCGHATLASAHVVFEFLEPGRGEVAFATRRSGELRVRRDGARLVMDFPAVPAAPVRAPSGLADAIGHTPREVLAVERDYVAVLDDPAAVRGLRPDLSALARLDRPGLVVTAPGGGDGIDFVSRFFAPALGVPEDPATGSSHCTLAPYWAGRLGKSELLAHQVSPRGAEIACALRGDRVELAGACVLFMTGEIRL